MREAEGRERDPSGAVIDSQAVRGTGVDGPERGYDGAKRLSGRKRHLLVDTGGLVLGAHVHAASLHDRDGAQFLLTGELKEELPRLELVVGGRRIHSQVSRVGRGGMGVAGGGDSTSGPPALAQRVRGEAPRLPGTATS